MAYTSVLATLLEQFFADVARVPKPRFETTRDGVQVHVSTSGNGVGFRSREEIFAACVAALSEADRVQLDRLLDAMGRTVAALRDTAR